MSQRTNEFLKSIACWLLARSFILIQLVAHQVLHHLLSTLARSLARFHPSIRSLPRSANSVCRQEPNVKGCMVRTDSPYCVTVGYLDMKVSTFCVYAATCGCVMVLFMFWCMFLDREETTFGAFDDDGYTETKRFCFGSFPPLRTHSICRVLGTY